MRLALHGSQVHATLQPLWVFSLKIFLLLKCFELFPVLITFMTLDSLTLHILSVFIHMTRICYLYLGHLKTNIILLTFTIKIFLLHIGSTYSLHWNFSSCPSLASTYIPEVSFGYLLTLNDALLLQITTNTPLLN